MKVTSEFINISDYHNSPNDNILDIQNLGAKTGQVKIAICAKCVVKRTVDNNPFISYTFKDYKGRTISGRQFAVENLDENISKLVTLKNQPLLINYDTDYFRGFYLKINSVKFISVEQAREVKDKFFITEIEGLTKEKAFFIETLQEIKPNENYMSIYRLFNVEDRLSNGYYDDVLEGLKGSPVKVVNLFASNVITMFNRKEGKYLILAFILLESILASCDNSPLQVTRNLDSLAELCKNNIDPAIKRIYELVESSVFLIFNFDKQLFDSGSIYITSIRKFLLETLSCQNEIDRQIGVFDYKGNIFEKRSN